MAPKKARTRESSSQPMPDTRPQARRNGKKRRHSDASNVSDRPSSSQSITTPSAPKRRKRTRASTEPDVIVEVEETGDALGEGDAAQPECDVDTDRADTTQSTSERHVHFGHANAGAQLEDVSEEELERATATHITPHPHKMTIKRRVTTSPSVRLSEGSKSVKVTTSRTSLPATLVQDGSDPFYILEEHHFAPLREVVRERIQKRQALHAGKAERIRELELELETQSQVGNVERVQKLHDHIASVRKEYKHVISEGDVMELLDDDMLVLDGEEAVTYPQMPTPVDSLRTADETSTKAGYHAESLALVESQSIQEAWNAERRQFGDAIMALSREANEAKTELQILKIELLALGFGSEDVSVSTVLLSIRESFSRIREGMELMLPGSLPDEDVSNQNLIQILLANIKDFTERLYTQDRELLQKTSLISDLGQQVHGLVDHLAEAKIRSEKLEQGWSELDQSNEDKARRLGNVEDELFKTEEERNGLEEDLELKVKEALTLQEENRELSKSLQRLTESLEKYRDEETRLTDLISRMEEEHQATVSKMNRERENTVRQLEDQIDNHVKLQNAAELLAEERQTMIIGLELQIETVEGERHALQVELQEVKLSRDQEQGARETAEAELDEKSAEVQDLEGRVDRLEEELTQLNVQLEELRQVNETERTQRESAENDLDERNADVEQLNQRLREQGIKANELRQKLFEVQQTNEQTIKELEEAASEREEQYQVDIAKEVERRGTADDLAQQRAETISALEIRLEQLEIEMRQVIAIRDERIATLEDELVLKNSQIDTLRSDLRSVEELYENQVAEGAQQRQDLEASIATLKITISEHETLITKLRHEATHTVSLHDSEMDDRNSHIAELNYRIAAFQTQITELEATKADLERRIEHEAASTLQLQAQTEDELARLRATIADKQAKILLVEQKVLDADAHWQELLAARDVEIATLTTSSQTTTSTLSAVTADLTALKRRFREYVRRSSVHVAQLQEALATARAVVDGECAAVEEDGLQMLAELEAMAEYSEEMMVEVTTSSSQRTVSNSQTSSSAVASAVMAGGKKGRGRKRRIMDSGIGMEMDGEEA